MVKVKDILGIEEKDISEIEINSYDEMTCEAVNLKHGYNSLANAEVVVDIDTLAFCIYMYKTGLSKKLARNNWTAKHFQNKDKNESYQEGLAIATAIESGSILSIKKEG